MRNVVYHICSLGGALHSRQVWSCTWLHWDHQYRSMRPLFCAAKRVKNKLNMSHSSTGLLVYMILFTFHIFLPSPPKLKFVSSSCWDCDWWLAIHSVTTYQEQSLIKAEHSESYIIASTWVSNALIPPLFFCTANISQVSANVTRVSASSQWHISTREGECCTCADTPLNSTTI